MRSMPTCAGLGRVRLVNLLAVVPGASPRTIVVLAHRDNSGTNPGANDNASGTGVLLELARNAELVRPKHTLVFVSTDGGAFGGAGAARIADRPEVIRRLVGTAASVFAVVNLDSLAGREPPRILFAGEAPRSPTSALLATTDESIERRDRRGAAQADGVRAAHRSRVPVHPARAGAVRRARDAGGHDHDRRRAPADRRAGHASRHSTGTQLGALGRSAQDLLLRLDDSAELARSTQSYLYLGTRLRARVDDPVPPHRRTPSVPRGHGRPLRALPPAPRPARARPSELREPARRLALDRRSLRALRRRRGARRGRAAPDQPRLDRGAGPADRQRSSRSRSSPRSAGCSPGPASSRTAGSRREEELGGHLAAMLVLALVALVVAATNPYALLFVLPSLHAWLWLAARGPPEPPRPRSPSTPPASPGR